MNKAGAAILDKENAQIYNSSNRFKPFSAFKTSHELVLRTQMCVESKYSMNVQTCDW